MRDNTMGPLYYIWAHIYWAWLISMFFMTRLFRPIISVRSGTFMTKKESVYLFVVLLVCMTLLGAASTIKNQRNYLYLVINVLAPCGLYLILEMLPSFPLFFDIMVLIWLIALGYSVYRHLIIPVPKAASPGEAMAKRFRSLLHCVHFLGGTLLCSVAIICVTGSVFGCQLIKAEKDQIYEAIKGTSYELRDYREQLYALSPEKWEELPLEDKVKTAQVIVNIETAYLGLPDQISVAATDLAPRTLGSYDHERRLILINKEHLDKDAPEECIDTILHEVYHSYQHHLLEIYESTDSRYRNMLHIREASPYVYEFENYINGLEDFDEYSSQSVERDARKYAEDRMNQYRPAIYGLTGLVVS